MTNTPEEPTALQASDMLLKMAALLGASVVCIKAIDHYFECVPQSNWLNVAGPAIFTAFAVLLAGRILIWNMLGAYISAVPFCLARLIIRAILCGLLVFSFATAASVFSPFFAGENSEVCSPYTLFNLF